MQPHQVEWRDGEGETVTSVGQLDSLLDRLNAEAADGPPLLVHVGGPAGSLAIGIGRAESVLTFIYPDGDPPYLVSNNGTDDETEYDFFMRGHHSAFPGYSIIPIQEAREAMRVFVASGALSLNVRWGEI